MRAKNQKKTIGFRLEMMAFAIALFVLAIGVVVFFNLPDFTCIHSTDCDEEALERVLERIAFRRTIGFVLGAPIGLAGFVALIISVSPSNRID